MIEIIIDKTILDDFGKKGLASSKLLDRIFTTDKNLFVLTKQLNEFIESNADEIQLAKWMDLFTTLSDNNKILKANNDTLDSRTIFNEPPKRYDYVLVLTSKLSDDISCSLNDPSRVNLCFLNLLKNDSNVILPYTHFTSNIEINSFLNKLFFYSRAKNQKIIMVSRHLRCDSEIVKMLNIHFPQKEYWTTQKRHPDITNNRSDLQKKMGSPLSLYLGRPSDIHERQLIIGNLVVNMDDDFDKISTEYKTWQLSIIIDKNFADTLRKKRSSLRLV